MHFGYIFIQILISFMVPIWQYAVFGLHNG